MSIIYTPDNASASGFFEKVVGNGCLEKDRFLACVCVCVDLYCRHEFGSYPDSQTTNNEDKMSNMTPKMVEIWNLANEIIPRVNPLRNPDKSIRNAFKMGRDVVGSRWWALYMAQTLACPTTQFTDDVADQILSGLREF